MEPVEGAIAEGTKFAAVTAEVGTKTASGAAVEKTSSPSPMDQEAVNRIIDRVSELRQKASDNHVGLVDVSGNPLAPKNPDTSPKTPEVAISEKPQTVEINAETSQKAEGISEIYNNPKFKEILGKIAAQETNGKVTLKEMQAKAMVEYGKEIIEEVTQEAQEQENNVLTAEQKTIITKEIGKAFKDNPSDLSAFTREAAALAKAKINETRLQGDQNTTQDQKTKAAELTSQLKNKYDLRLKEMIEKIRTANPQENPENNPLVILLKDAPNNPEMLAIMQKEAKKSLLKKILEWVLVFTMPSLEQLTEEAEKTTISSLSGQQT